MDFAEFAAQYQRRTAKRMADFEAVMRETQRKMEFTAQQQAIARETLPRHQYQPPRGDYSLPRPRKAQQQKRQVRAVLQARQHGSGGATREEGSQP